MIEAVMVRIDGVLVVVKVEELPRGVFRATVGEGLDVFSEGEDTELANAVLKAVNPDGLPFQELFSRIKQRVRKLQSGVLTDADYRYFDSLMIAEAKQRQLAETIENGDFFREAS